MTIRVPSRRRLMSAAAATLAAAAGGVACAPAASAQPGSPPRLRRGVNLHHLLNWPELASGPGEPVRYRPRAFSDPGHAFDEGEAGRLRAAGFDFVRLTVDPAIHLAAPPEGRAALQAVVLDRVRRLRSRDLSVIVDLHPVSQNLRYAPERLTAASAPDFPAYAALVGRLAAALAAGGDRGVALEPFNEPPGVGPEDVRRWQGRLELLHAAARAAAPGLALVLNGGAWDASSALQQLDLRPFRAGPVIYTFHYYTPHLFTHQGVEADVTRYVRDLTWPADAGADSATRDAALARLAADRSLAPPARAAREAELRRDFAAYPAEASVERVERDFSDLAGWAGRNGVASENLLLGEFGAVKPADPSPGQRRSRLAWLAAVRSAAERRRFPWAYWALKGYGGMELIPAGGRAMDADTLAALGLQSTASGRRG